MTMRCPACGADTSAVFGAFEQGEPCPYCGLSAEASAEIAAIQQSRADAELKAKLAEEIRRRDAAEAKAARLESQLDRIRRALDGKEDEPW